MWEAAVEELAKAHHPNFKYLEKCLTTALNKATEELKAGKRGPPPPEYPIWALIHCPRCGWTTRVDYTTLREPATVKCEPCDRIMPFGAWRMWAFGNVPLSPVARE